MAWDKKTSMKDGLVPFLVYTDGKVDLPLSNKKFNDAATLFKAKNEADEEVVLSALHSLFDTYKGVALNVPAVVSGTVTLMSQTNPLFANPQLFGTLSKRITDVLEANTVPKNPVQGDTKVYAFDVKRGAGGGHFRISDQAPAK